MGHKFSLVLSREITDNETAILRESGCTNAIFGTDELPASAEVTVTKMDFNDEASDSLTEAIESALKAVDKLPDLSVPCLSVPPQDEDELDDASATAGEMN